jgi:hypothetical protein
MTFTEFWPALSTASCHAGPRFGKAGCLTIYLTHNSLWTSVGLVSTYFDISLVLILGSMLILGWYMADICLIYRLV